LRARKDRFRLDPLVENYNIAAKIFKIIKIINYFKKLIFKKYIFIKGNI